MAHKYGVSGSCMMRYKKEHVTAALKIVRCSFLFSDSVSGDFLFSDRVVVANLSAARVDLASFIRFNQ